MIILQYTKTVLYLKNGMLLKIQVTSMRTAQFWTAYPRGLLERHLHTM